MPRYDQDYSVLQVKALISKSERRIGKFNLAHPNTGHALRDHQAITDADIVKKKKSAFIDKANSFKTTVPSKIANLPAITVWKKTKTNDQAFIIANILNSPYGQAALAKLNTAISARVTLYALPFSFLGKEFNIRVKSGSGVDATQAIARLVIVVENGFDDLHFVTGYPTKDPIHKTFGIWPGVTRTLAFGAAVGDEEAWFWDGPPSSSNSKLRPLP